MKNSEADWQRLKNILILLLVFAFCLYLPTLFHGAFADDDVYLAFANHFLRESHWSDLYQFFLRPANPLEFLPLRDLSYWLDFRLFGDELNGFHATNLLWYVASAWAAFGLFRQMIFFCKPTWAARANVLSLCGVLLFVAHPAHVEAAAWISSRKDLIAGTLVLFSAAVLAKALRYDWPWRSMGVAALLFFAACFGKAAAMTGVLFASVLIGVGWRGAPDIARARKASCLLLFWILFAAVFLIHLKVGENSGIRIENFPGVFAIIERASRTVGSLLGILLFPYPMHFYYDVYQVGDWHWLVSMSFTLLLLAALWVLSHRRSLWAFGIILVFSPLIIYLQFVPFKTWSLASERFVFVSVAGLSLGLIDLLGRIDNTKKIIVMVLVIVLPCAATVWSRIGEWGDLPVNLILREYELQPSFHNAIRDQIVIGLLPQRHYDQANALAGQLQRPYVSEALLALVVTEESYQRMHGARSDKSGGEDAVLRQNFCEAADRLRAATRNLRVHLKDEPDVSYFNIRDSLDYALRFSYGDARVMCSSDN